MNLDLLLLEPHALRMLLTYSFPHKSARNRKSSFTLDRHTVKYCR